MTAPADPSASPPAAPSGGAPDLPGSDPVVARLFPGAATGVRWGLERTRAALRDLGSPHRGLPFLHVGGTNGKGSVSSLLASALAAGGARTGLYTSPHLRVFRERIRIGGEPVSDEVLLDEADRIRPVLERHGLTFFESATVLALCVFRRAPVDAAVLEVGLGGRLDATNVVIPEVSVITNVALDHADYLGDTLEAVAREKAGILKAGVPAVTGSTEAVVLEVLRDRAARIGISLREVDADREVVVTASGVTGSEMVLDTAPWGRLRLRIPLPGRHQVWNAALAVRALEALPDGLRPDAGALRTGFTGVRWPGRLQIERLSGVTWIFDVAHNVAGAGALAEALDALAPPRPRVLVVGVLGDKDWRAMLPPLLDRVDGAVLTLPASAPEARRWDPRQALTDLGSPPGAEILESLAEAVQEASRRAGPGGTVLVTGSHYTVGDALATLAIPA